MIKSIALVAGAALFVAGCQSGPGGTPNNTLIGAGLGAATGAALGTLAGGNDTRNALIGAGIGVLAGGAVGSYMDRQEQALRQGLTGSQIGIARKGDLIILTVPGELTFPTGSSQIQPQFYSPLQQIAATLNQYPQSYVNVIGYTDSTGPLELNMRLSRDRANSVSSFLVSQSVLQSRLIPAGRGPAQPIGDNATDFGRQLNRRVEIEIIPLT